MATDAAPPAPTPSAAGKAAAVVNRHESHLRSIAKAISWRTTGTIDTFVLSWIITGSIKFAGTIAGTEVVTKVALYYFHERIWAIVPWGRRPA